MWKRLRALIASRRARSRAQRRGPLSHRDGNREEHPARHEPGGRAPAGAEELRSDGKAQGRNARCARHQLVRNAASPTSATASRALVKHPGYAALAVLTLGLGIGANTAIFSVINGVLLKPLPYEHGDRLVVVRQSRAAVGPAPGRRRDRGVLRLSRARHGRVRRPGRVPPDELRPAQPRRARSRQHRRRLAQLLRPARHQADRRPHLRRVRRRARRRGGAGPEPHLLAHQVRRRPEHRRPGVRDERPAAPRDRRAAQRAALSAGERRLHAGAGVPVPRRRGTADRAEPARVRRPERVRPAEAGRRRPSRRRAPSAPSATASPRTTRSVYRPDSSGFQATTARRARRADRAARATCC